jgi:hypothetical protein
MSSGIFLLEFYQLSAAQSPSGLSPMAANNPLFAPLAFYFYAYLAIKTSEEWDVVWDIS